MNRTEILKNKLKELGIEALLVTSEVNQRYVTGFEYSDGYALVTQNGVYLITDFRYIEAAKKEASPEYEIITHGGELAKTLAELVDATVCIGYEDASITVEVLEQYQKALPSARFMGAGRIVEGLRIKKEDCEIDAMIAAQRIAEKAFDHILGFITPDRTEIEVALELEFTMRKLGAQATSFNTIAVSGEKSAGEFDV